MVSCTVVEPGGYRMSRFLVFDESRLILVEPDTSRLGWGIVRLVAPIQNVYVIFLSPLFFFEFFLIC